MHIPSATTTTITFGDPRKVLIGRLFKEDKITMDEMLLLLGQSPAQNTYPQFPQQQIPPYQQPPNPYQVTCKTDTPFTLTGGSTYFPQMLTVTNTTLKN